MDKRKYFIKIDQTNYGESYDVYLLLMLYNFITKYFGSLELAATCSLADEVKWLESIDRLCVSILTVPAGKDASAVAGIDIGSFMDVSFMSNATWELT